MARRRRGKSFNGTSPPQPTLSLLISRVRRFVLPPGTLRPGLAQQPAGQRWLRNHCGSQKRKKQHPSRVNSPWALQGVGQAGFEAEAEQTSAAAAAAAAAAALPAAAGTMEDEEAAQRQPAAKKQRCLTQQGEQPGVHVGSGSASAAAPTPLPALPLGALSAGEGGEEADAEEGEQQQQQGQQRVCSHCGADRTSGKWRRHPTSGARLCGACGQYVRQHDGQLRPVGVQCLECGSDSP